MSLWLGIGVVLATNVVAVVVMLLLRGRAPAGGYYHDTQQAGWVYSVAGTAFAVILAFVFLLAFESFDRARTAATEEAEATAALFHTAELFPPAERDALQAQLVCYARGVIALEWPAMDHRRSSPEVQRRVREIERTFQRAPSDDVGAKVSAAYDAWFAQMQDRQDGRQERLDQAARFVPPFVWIFLLTGGVLVVGFVWLFADRSERRFAQAALPIGVATMVASGLVLVSFFDRPYQDTPGAVRPTSLERSLAVLEAERATNAPGAPLPCDASGRPT